MIEIEQHARRFGQAEVLERLFDEI
jgi:hypothetical protein